MKYTLSFIILLITGCAMDYSISSEIINNSTKEIAVTIVFDKEELSKTSPSQMSNNYFMKIKYYNDRIGKPVTFDSNTLRTKFILPPNNKSEISHNVGGMHVKPDYSIIKQILISGNNINKLYDRATFDTLFKDQKDGSCQLIIK